MPGRERPRRGHRSRVRILAAMRMLKYLVPQIALGDLPSMCGVALIGAVIAGVYGVLHDQITYAISPEYFTHMKFKQFHYADVGLGDRVFVATIGFLAASCVWLDHRLVPCPSVDPSPAAIVCISSGGPGIRLCVRLWRVFLAARVRVRAMARTGCGLLVLGMGFPHDSTSRILGHLCVWPTSIMPVIWEERSG